MAFRQSLQLALRLTFLASSAFALAQPAIAQKQQAGAGEAPVASPGQGAERAEQLRSEGIALYNAGDFAGAEALFAEALQLYREALGQRHSDTLVSMGNHAETLRRLGRYEEAERLYRRALRLRGETFGIGHPGTLATLNAYFSLLQSQGRGAEAEPIFAELVQLLREELGEDHRSTLIASHNYASILTEMGRLAEAETLFADALNRLRATLGARDPATLNTLGGYASVLKDLGRIAEAEPLYAEALRLQREVLGERNPDTIRSLNNYALVLQDLGRAEEAEPLYAEALRLQREVLGERHPDTLRYLNNYASVLQTLGRAEEAEPIAAEVLRLRREVLGVRHPDTLVSLNNYATVLLGLGRTAEAESYYAEALRLKREVWGERHPDTLLSMANHALVLQTLGRLPEAEQLYLEVLSLQREVLGERHPNTIDSLSGYAALLQDLGRFDEAEPLAEQAVQLGRELRGDRHPLTFYSLANYIVLLQLSGQPHKALPWTRELSAILRTRAVERTGEGVRGSVQGNRELRDRRNVEKVFADVLWENFEQSPDQSQGLRDEAFSALQLASTGSASRAVTEAAALRFASGEGLQELVQERQQLLGDWADIEAAQVESQASGADGSVNRDRLRTALAQIEERIAEIDAVLATDAPQYFAILNQQTVALEQAQQVLGEDEAVLFLVPTGFGTHLMAVTREGIGWQRSDMNVLEIDSAVAEFREGLEVTGGNGLLPLFDLEQAHTLYQRLIAPVEGALQGKDRVYIVADGALSRLPLGTLVATAPADGADPDDPEVLRDTDWLADRYALVQLPSLQSLVYIRSFGVEDSGDGAIGFMGFGDPVLEGQSRLRGARSGTLPALDAASLLGDVRGTSGTLLMDPSALRQLSQLPGTRQELEQVRMALGAGESSLFLGESMTETAIRNTDLSSTHILHLATHGFTSEESGSIAEPGLVFTPPSAAERGNDGYLAASEIVGLDLSSANWVILSACNTASPSGGAGETGLSGLAQSFFYAGAESLLVSHWPVFDDIAPVITLKALQRSQAGESRAEALQAAMREIRDDPLLDAAHPAVWAPFTLVGEGR